MTYRGSEAKSFLVEFWLHTARYIRSSVPHLKQPLVSNPKTRCIAFDGIPYDNHKCIMDNFLTASGIHLSDYAETYM
jgi:hypothetical protein